MSNNKNLDKIRALKNKCSDIEQSIQVGREHQKELRIELESANATMSDLVQDHTELKLEIRRLQEN